MLEWARQVMHRLLQDQNTSLETGGRLDEHTLNGLGQTTGGFDRFLQEFEANNDEEMHRDQGGKRAA